jgi:5-formyltetrahydrofolate cyclo-ligase
VFSVAAALGLPAAAQTNGTPTDASAGTAEIAKQTELIKAQKDLLEAQNNLITERFRLLGEGFGKTGELTFGTPDRDVFHVTARSAEAFKAAAKDLAQKLQPHAALRGSTVPCIGPIVMLVEEDRSAVRALRSEALAVGALVRKATLALALPEKVEIKSVFEIGTLLGQLSQFTQIFRTDRDVSFTSSALPDQLLLDLVAVELKGHCLGYPAGEEDRLLSTKQSSKIGGSIIALLQLRDELIKKNTADTKAVIAEVDPLLQRIATPGNGTAPTYLSTLLRGELVEQYLGEPNAMTLSITVVSKGGPR